MDISSIRKDYTLKSLDMLDVNQNPMIQFNEWFKAAIDSNVLEVNAMTLSTLGMDGFPNGRIVLLKEVDHGFVFFTNYESEKGREISSLGKGSLTFFWPELERQVRIQGVIDKVSEQESDNYFFSRPKSSQIGAWASPQSKIILSRSDLTKEENRLKELYEFEKIERPPHWGGYRLSPIKIEFWQGRSSRLHDRIVYTVVNNLWEISRLAP